MPHSRRTTLPAPGKTQPENRSLRANPIARCLVIACAFVVGMWTANLADAASRSGLDNRPHASTQTSSPTSTPTRGPERTAAADDGPIFRQVGGEIPYDLELIPGKLVVFYPEGTPDATKDAVEQSFPWLSNRTVDQSFPKPEARVLNVPTEPGAPANILERRATELRRRDDVVHATPVYRSFGIEVYPLNEVLVQVGLDDAESTLSDLLSDYPLELAERTFWREGNFRLRITDPEVDAIEMSERLRNSGQVRYAQPNYVRRLKSLAEPDDPHFGSQWSLHNDAPVEGDKDCDLDAPEGWEITEGCDAVTIAILDEGCDESHDDYRTNLVAGWDVPFDDGNANPNRWDGHGTACAGIAAAISNNTEGIAGVASGARIMPVRIAYSPFNGAFWVTTDAWLADGLAFAFLNGADVLSNSWGGGPPSEQIHAAIRDAVIDGCGGRGAVVVFAAGNDNWPSPSYPAIYPETICVGATSPCDERKSPTSCDPENWWGSNYGDGLDVSAPGVHIPATDIEGGGGYDPGDYYLTFNGTSSATPQVAGLAALLMCEYPSYKGTEIRARIEQTCDKVGGYAYDADTGISFELGHGRINIFRALSGRPQIAKGPDPEWPSVYQDEGDQKDPVYPAAEHGSSAYEWFGEEVSAEVVGADDADGVSNDGGRDAFDDGIKFFPPYLPGQMGSVEVTVSVENSNSERYVGHPLYVNVWFDWQSDGSWAQPWDWMVKNEVVDPSTWGGGQTQTITYTFLVPDADIRWRVQDGANGKYLNIRSRLSYDQMLADAGADADYGEVEDDWFVNFYESFEMGFGNTHVAENCPVWVPYDGSEPWTCTPAFPNPDGPPNDYACAEIYHPGYAGDDLAEVRTPTFDFTEFTEATLLFDHSGVEAVTGHVVVYEDGIEVAILQTYNDPLAAAPCAPVLSEIFDLTPWTGDGMDNVQIAFRTFHGDACGTALPNYQDWKIDNVLLIARDTIVPSPVAVTMTPLALGVRQYDWVAEGDDGSLRQAELYNLRVNPVPIDATNWRHSIWMQRDLGMVTGLVPSPPGALETYTQKSLAGGMNYACVRPLDEVNQAAAIVGAGSNTSPTVTAPLLVTVAVGDTVDFDVAATDVEFDPLMLVASPLPGAAKFTDHGDNTGTFYWIPNGSHVGDHDVDFDAKDWNGLCGTATTTIRVEDVPPGQVVPGACCFADGCCQMLSQADCIAAGGAPDWPGSVCTPNPCPGVDPDVATHDTGLLKYTVSSQGTLGWRDETQTDGDGLIYPVAGGGPSELYIGGFWLGADSFYVANRDYDQDPYKEWKVTSCPSGRTDTQGFGAMTTIRATFNDDDASYPRGLEVTLDSRSWSSSGDDGFVILNYQIHNRGALDLTGLHAGVFQDFDLDGNPNDDTVGSEAGRKLIWMTDPSGIHVGIALLNGSLALQNLAVVDNPTYIYPDGHVKDGDKYGFLAATDAAHSISSSATPQDQSIVVSSESFDLPVGGLRHVAFAIIVGSSQAELLTNADAAAALFAVSDVPDGTLPGGDVPGEPDTFTATRLLPIAPNPIDFSHGPAGLRLQLAQGADFSVSVYDANGRLVRGLKAGGRLSPGEYLLNWDGRDQNGRPVESGVYFLRLAGVRAAENTQRLVVIR